MLRGGLSVFGTCAVLILLAKLVEDCKSVSELRERTAETLLLVPDETT